MPEFKEITPKPMPSEWLSLSEAAALIGVHPSTVRTWADQGHLPVHRTQGGHRRFRRDDVEVWMHTQKPNQGIELGNMVHSALRRTRFEISEGKLADQGWYQKLDNEAREQYRQSGRSLLFGLMNFLSSEEVMDAEARSLGYEYASRGHRFGLNSVEAVGAFLFFRNLLLDSMLTFYEEAGVRSPQAWAAMYRKMQAFTDHILTTLLATYEAYQRSGK